MKKIPVHVLILLSGFNHLMMAQSIYYKSEMEVEGMPAMVAKMSKTNSETWFKKGKSKTFIKTMAYSQTQYINGENVTIVNTSDPKCVQFSKADMAKDSVVNSMYTSDVTVKKTTETKKILGYDCVKTIVRYKIANKDNKTASMTCEVWIWSTTALKLPPELFTAMETTQRNSLAVVMMSVEGFVLSTETLVKENNMKTIMNVTEIQTKDLDDSEFEPKASLCKKPMGLQEYNEYLIRKNKTPTGWH